MTGKELEKIYNESYRAVYWTAFSLLKNEDDAQDIVQDTFVSLINSYDSIKDKSKILPWLKKVAANKSLNRLTRTKTDNVEDEFFDTVETVPEDFLPDSLVESAETRRIIMDIINNSLSEDIRRTLILFYFDEMSTREVAEALGIPEGTVSWRINSAKKKIKKEVEKYEEDNDTKLFMVVPFLTNLFTKEAEQVPFRPMPASLLNLSASTEAASQAAGSQLASQAVKKGTEIAMKKIIISIVSITLAGAALAGIIYFATRENEKSDSKKSTKKDAENEITMIDPDDESETTPVETEGTEDNSGADSAFGGSDRKYVNFNDLKLKINGTVITMNQSTVQDIVDTGCYVNPYMLDRNYAYGNKLDDNVEAGKLVCMTVFDMDDETDRPAGKNFNDPITILARAEKDGPITDCVICGYYFSPEFSDAWENEIVFEFPFTLTQEDLVKNSGDPTTLEKDGDYASYLYEYEDSSMRFTFYKGALYSFVGEYDEGSIIKRGTIASAKKG